MTIESSSAVRQSRRAVLAGAMGGLAAAVATALGRPSPANAAAGDSLVLGSETNNAGSANTQLLTNSNVVAFKLLQNGPGTALMGYVTPTSGATRGVYGRTDSPNGFGVQGYNGGVAGTGAAVQAIGVNNNGVHATTSSFSRAGVRAEHLAGGYAVHASSNGRGVYGVSSASYGVEGRSDAGEPGVYGSSAGSGVYGGGGVAGVSGVSASGSGVEGFSNGDAGHGVVGSIGTNSITAAGVYGEGAGDNSYAGYFVGHVAVSGVIENAAVVSRIDHPLDPANRLLQHSAVVGPEMLNLYSGVATLDAGGEATVAPASYVDALNGDFRYQLTPLGAAMPGLHVGLELVDGRFTISGGTPGGRVSWQLTGIRKDAWAEAHRVTVERDKAGDQRGTYLYPIEHGQPQSRGVDYPMQQRLAAQRSHSEELGQQ